MLNAGACWRFTRIIGGTQKNCTARSLLPSRSASAVTPRDGAEMPMRKVVDDMHIINEQERQLNDALIGLGYLLVIDGIKQVVLI